MRGIGGKTKAVIQVSSVTQNAMGEHVKSWTDVQSITGWLDMASGDSRYETYSAKVLESTHIFIAGYVPLDSRIKPETSRMLIDGQHYDITLLDNPMNMKSGSQWEIYLKFTGGR